MTVPEQYFSAQIQRQWSLTPAMRRLVLGGSELKAYRSSGVADEWFRFLLPAESESEVARPLLVDGHWQFSDPQPQSRWYTVRHVDPDRGELTVDVVMHAHGLATRWAAQVTPGDDVLISAPTGRYGPAPEAEWELLVADLTGLPAASRIISELAPGRRARAILEVPDEDCVLTFETEADLEVSWIFNPTPDVTPSTLGAATRSVDLLPDPGYVWMAGEAGCSREIRRYFRHELKWPSSAYDIVSYWRPDAEAYLKRYTIIEDDVAKIYHESYDAGRDSEDTVDEVLAVMEAHGL